MLRFYRNQLNLTDSVDFKSENDKNLNKTMSRNKCKSSHGVWEM